MWPAVVACACAQHVDYPNTSKENLGDFTCLFMKKAKARTILWFSFVIMSVSDGITSEQDDSKQRLLVSGLRAMARDLFLSCQIAHARWEGCVWPLEQACRSSS